jgi:hypothetical protein
VVSVSTVERKVDFKPPILFREPPVSPIETPEHIHEQNQSPGDDRGSLPWLLTAEEESERNKILQKLSDGIQLTDAERRHLAYLMSKRGLADSESKATMITQEDGSVFTR